MLDIFAETFYELLLDFVIEVWSVPLFALLVKILERIFGRVFSMQHQSIGLARVRHLGSVAEFF